MANILLVDDDSVLLKLYSTRLRADKHEVVTASNGEEALEKLKTFKPDVFVIDLLMPMMNGFSLIEKINTIPALQKIHKIVFSSVASDEQLARLKALGVNNYLNKIDTTPTQLVQAINNTLA